MITPTIHMNGTSRTALLDALLDAGHAVTLAREALMACAPHGRDYYPQGEAAIGQATREHLALDTALRDVHNAILARYDAILETP